MPRRERLDSRRSDSWTLASARPAGLTVLEVTISAAVLAVLVGVAFGVVTSAQLFLLRERSTCTAFQTGQRILVRIGEDLRQAYASSVFPLSGMESRWIEFRHEEKSSSGTVELGPTIRISLEPEDEEAIDGLDNDGDGRIDEGRILRREGDAAPVALAGQISDLRFTRRQRGVDVEVDVAFPDGRGDVVEETFSQFFSFRN